MIKSKTHIHKLYISFFREQKNNIIIEKYVTVNITR